MGFAKPMYPCFVVAALYYYIAEEREIDHLRPLFDHLPRPLTLRQIDDTQTGAGRSVRPWQASQRLDEIAALQRLLLTRLRQATRQIIDTGQAFQIHYLTLGLQLVPLSQQRCRTIAVDVQNRPHIRPIGGIGRHFHTYQVARHKVGGSHLPGHNLNGVAIDHQAVEVGAQEALQMPTTRYPIATIVGVDLAPQARKALLPALCQGRCAQAQWENNEALLSLFQVPPLGGLNAEAILCRERLASLQDQGATGGMILRPRLKEPDMHGRDNCALLRRILQDECAI